MVPWYRKYATYVTGVVIVIGCVLIAALLLSDGAHFERVALVCAGFLLGLISGSIARRVYV